MSIERLLEEMKPRGMVVAVPFLERPQHYDWGWTFGQMRWPMNIDLWFERIGPIPEVEIGEAREQFAENAVLHNAKWLAFLDSDVIPPLTAYGCLIQEMERRPRCGMIGAIYTDKREPNAPMVFERPGVGPYWHWKIGDVFRCGSIATGCCVILVEALRDMPRPWFLTVDKPWERWTEDQWFCKELTAAGWEIWAHGGVLCRHVDSSGREWFLPTDSLPFQLAREAQNVKLRVVGDAPKTA